MAVTFDVVMGKIEMLLRFEASNDLFDGIINIASGKYRYLCNVYTRSKTHQYGNYLNKFVKQLSE